MLTRSKLKLGEGELVEANTEIGRVYPRRIMEEAKTVCTPMVTGCSLSANDESAAVHPVVEVARWSRMSGGR